MEAKRKTSTSDREFMSVEWACTVSLTRRDFFCYAEGTSRSPQVSGRQKGPRGNGRIRPEPARFDCRQKRLWVVPNTRGGDPQTSSSSWECFPSHGWGGRFGGTTGWEAGCGAA